MCGLCMFPITSIAETVKIVKKKTFKETVIILCYMVCCCICRIYVFILRNTEKEKQTSLYNILAKNVKNVFYINLRV